MTINIVVYLSGRIDSKNENHAINEVRRTGDADSMGVG